MSERFVMLKLVYSLFILGFMMVIFCDVRVLCMC